MYYRLLHNKIIASYKFSTQAGYDLKELFKGVEGTLGIITEMAIVVPPKPRVFYYIAYWYIICDYFCVHKVCESSIKVHAQLFLLYSYVQEIIIEL